jgi:hypothetical protein
MSTAGTVTARSAWGARVVSLHSGGGVLGLCEVEAGYRGSMAATGRTRGREKRVLQGGFGLGLLFFLRSNKI